MNDFNIQYQIILASNSPRRRELLKMADFDFKVETVQNIDESFDNDIEISELPIYLARKKQNAFKHLWTIKNNLVITSDTIVCLKNKILNKPLNKNEAFDMLMELSGQMHKVITGVVLKSKNKEIEFAETTKVWFKKLTASQINYYIDNYKPFDKAGAYGIQEWIGMIGISKIEGSYFNVMGLPIDRIYDELKKF